MRCRRDTAMRHACQVAYFTFERKTKNKKAILEKLDLYDLH